MGEKGNVTSEELVTAVAGTGAVVAGQAPRSPPSSRRPRAPSRTRSSTRVRMRASRARPRSGSSGETATPRTPRPTRADRPWPGRTRAAPARPWWRWLRTTAHRDDAKARTDDASAAARRGFPRKLLVGGGALVLVAVAGCSRSPQSGEDGGTTPLAVAAAADPTSAAPSASEDPEPTPEEILAGSVPTGKWKMVQTFKYSIQRDGQRSQSWSYDPITRTWKFPPADCTAAACSGSLRSSSGSTFEFTWDGKRAGRRRTPVNRTRGQAGLRRPGDR